MKRQMLCSTALTFFMTATMPSLCLAQAQALSTEPPVVEYQYQLSYPRIWGWPGPGLSLGGSLPAKGREGISSFYGAPFPAPMGAGVYMNPFGYSSRLPGPFSFGLAQSTPTLPSPSAAPTGTDLSVLQAATNQLPAQAPAEPTSIPNLVQSGRPIASSAEAIRRCREIELIGDAHFKDGNWNQAVVNYRNAVITAPDRAEAHYRLGISNAMLESFADAANELSRAVSIDPKLASTRHIIDEIFGSEKRSIPNTIVMNAATWANEDLQKPDRLLVLGVVLQCASDSRSDAILAAASRSYERQEQTTQQMALTVPPSPSYTPAASIPSFPR